MTLDLDHLRTEWESDDQWGIRKAFLERHWGSMGDNEDRLVCLSTMFINMEFMGCVYSKQLMDTVNEMAAGLVENRREERRKTIEKIFVKSAEDQRKERKRQEKKAKKNQKPTPIEPEAKRRRLGDTPSESDTGVKPAASASKERFLLLLKAQLSVAPSDLSPLDLMNYCCNRAKVKWNLEFLERNGRQEFMLLVDDVIVTRQCYNTDDKQVATTAGCDSATKRLISAMFDVKEEDVVVSSNGQKAKKFCLYTSNDKRQGWEGPEAQLFVYQQRHLEALRRRLDGQIAAARNKDPVACLQTACTAVGAPFSIDSDQLEGWKVRLSVRVAGVTLASDVLQGKQLSGQQMNENRRRLAKIAMDQLVTAVTRQLIVSEDANGALTVTLGADSGDSDAARKAAIADARAPTEVIKETVSKTKLILFRNADDDVLSHARAILQNSCQVCNLSLDYAKTALTEPTRTRVQVFVGGSLVSQAEGENEKTACEKAAFGGFKSLSAHCPTIMRKAAIDQATTAISVEDVMSDLSGSKALSKGASSERIEDSNIGSQMLKKMGWKGGGIGKKGEGIAEPISVQQVFNRQGLGKETAAFGSKKHQRQFETAARRIIVEFLKSDQQSDLVFAADLNNEQRAVVHKLAGQYKLKSQSYGQGEDRQLTVQKKRSAHQLLQMLLEMGGESTKYVVIPPGLEQC